MNTIQKLTLIIFIPLTIAVLMVIFMIPSGDTVQFVKFSVTAVMFTAALVNKSKDRIKNLIKIAFLFYLIGDFFLAMMAMINQNIDKDLFGTGFFLIAYIFLIAAFQNGMKVENIKKEIVYLLPPIIVISFFFATMHKYVKGIMFPIAIIFSITITYMMWTGMMALKRGYFTKKVAWMITLAVTLIFISDLVVAYEMFLPAFADPPAWVEALVRGTFIPAWMMFLLILSEDKIRGKNPKI